MPNTTTVVVPAVCIISGPTDQGDLVAQSLRREGLECSVPHDHGLPSYSDPLTAHAAGAPNSGHTPGTPHPATLHFVSDTEKGETEERDNPLEEHVGSEYEDDPTIGFLAIQSEEPDRVQSLVAGRGWALRVFTAPFLHTVEDPDDLTAEERIARIESDLAIVRRGR